MARLWGGGGGHGRGLKPGWTKNPDNRYLIWVLVHESWHAWEIVYSKASRLVAMNQHILSSDAVLAVEEPARVDAATFRRTRATPPVNEVARFVSNLNNGVMQA